jgi:hypothetical protein
MSQTAVLRHLLNLRAGFDEEAICSQSSAADLLRAEPFNREPEADTVWHPTKLSQASRRPSLRGRGSVRGSLVDIFGRREIVFESRLERGLAEMLLARRDVSDILDQPPPVRYVTADGRTRTHTFDFLARTADGIRLAIAVKPEAKVERSGIQAVLALVREQVGPRFADVYLLRTDRHITPDRVYNARLILRSRVCRDETDVAAMWAIVDTLPGSFRIADVVIHSKLAARGFNALICLVDDCRLKPVGTGKIGYLTHLRNASEM